MQQKYTTNSSNIILYNKYLSCIIKCMRYTKKDFEKEFPDDDACLESIFQNRYGNVDTCPKCGVVDTKFYRVKGRKCYACMHCGYQLHPLAQTIFHKSSTPLTQWFYAIYLFSVSKNGVSAKELERHLGVTYKTAHRMARQIRKLMSQDKDDDSMLDGVVETDETYFGGKTYQKNWTSRKSAIIGAVERQGGARAEVVDGANATTALKFLGDNVKTTSHLMTDESRIYKRARDNFRHDTVVHSMKEYVRGDVHTNSIEGFWSQLKRSIKGTYHCVSPKYLQNYVDEFVFRYNYRDLAVCPLLLKEASKPF